MDARTRWRSRAVRETRGEIVTYEGAPILAYYHSTCGGRTAAIDEVWPRAAAVPELGLRPDRGTEERYYCEISNRFRWTESAARRQAPRVLEADAFGAYGQTDDDRAR